VRCCNAVEAEAARLEVDADILVIPSDYLGWKLALKTAHRFVTTAHVSPQKKHGEKDG
jgi:ribose 5-phosphate isomerase RpiB